MIVVEVIEGCYSDKLIKYVQNHPVGHRFTGMDLPEFTAVQFSNACDFLARKKVLKKLKERRKMMNRTGSQIASFIVMEVIDEVCVSAKRQRAAHVREIKPKSIPNINPLWDIWATPKPVFLGRGAIVHTQAM
jgi:hypothetical protein